MYDGKNECITLKIIKIIKNSFPGNYSVKNREFHLTQVQFDQFHERAGYPPRRRDRRANPSDPLNSLAFLQAREGQDHPLRDRCSPSSRNWRTMMHT